MMSILYLLVLITIFVFGTHQYLSTSTNPDTPQWFMDAKFGIMIHYGVYTVPAWAPPIDPQSQLSAPDFYYNNPYAAWYQNSMMIRDSPTYKYHLDAYGNLTYWDFKADFDIQSRLLNISRDWLLPIKDAMAKYVVLTTKHHDGMTLWHSNRRSSSIDIIGNYVTAISKTDLKLGLYYSGGFDWSFTNVSYSNYINSTIEAISHIPQSTNYVETVTDDYYHLIDTYRPKYIWNDIAIPFNVDLTSILKHYYQVVPDGAINDRKSKSLGILFINTVNELALWFRKTFIEEFTIRSLEYSPSYPKTRYYWEADKGAGWDFSYNMNDYANNTWSPKEAIDFIIMAAANNGNLLLGVTPYANGSLPVNQINLLRSIGLWLKDYGSTIFETRPVFQDLSMHWTYKQSQWNLFVPCCKQHLMLDVIDIPISLSSPFSISSKGVKCNYRMHTTYISIHLQCIDRNRITYPNYTIPITFKSI